MTAALSGLRVMVPVTSGRHELADAVRHAGAEAIEVEFIAIAPSTEPGALEAAVRDWCAGEYAWLAVTSRNAVLAMDAVAKGLGAQLSGAIPAAEVAAVGEATRTVCATVGLPVTLLPATATASGLLDDFPAAAGEGRVLVPVGDRASGILAKGLARKGWSVDSVEAYRTVAGRGPSVEQALALASGDVDAVLLTSGSMAAQVARACPNFNASTTMVAIGPTTAAAATAAGLTVAGIATRSTYASLVATLSSLIGRTA